MSKAKAKDETEGKAQALKAGTFDISDLDAQPDDGDLCEIKVFDTEHGKTVDAGRAIFDARRGVFFKEPKRDKTGKVTTSPVGSRRDNYKAERVRNVTEFKVIEPAYDPAPPPESVIDHRRGMDYAEDRPRSHHVPNLE